MTLKENLQMLKDFVEMSINPDKDFDKYYRSRSRLTLKIRNADEIIREKTVAVKSYHAGLIGTMQSNFVQQDQTNMRVKLLDRTGAVILRAGGQDWVVETTSANSNLGIIIGTSGDTIDLTDQDLTAKIAHGTGASQFDHSATTISALTQVGGKWSFTMDRDFLNTNGPNQTVREVGYYITSASTQFLAERTLVTELVETSESINCKYEEKVTV